MYEEGAHASVMTQQRGGKDGEKGSKTCYTQFGGKKALQPSEKGWGLALAYFQQAMKSTGAEPNRHQT